MAALEESITTRELEIVWYEEHEPDLAGDLGHLERIEIEETALQRCKDECEKNKKPESEPIDIPAWNVDPKTAQTMAWGTALAGGAYIISRFWWVFF